MPYEKSIFKHLFEDDIDLISQLNNITTYMEVNNCDKYERKLNKDNDELWNNCFLYIIIMSSLFFIMMTRDIWKNYTNYIIITITTVPRYDSKSAIVSFGSFQNLGDYKKNDDNESSVEMVTSPKNTTLTDTNGVIENPTFIKYYWYNSGFLAELIKTVEFIILVGIFEYLFFAYIVNKYKIANSKTILCNIYKKIN
jgi:hypothetical protein